MLVAYSYVPAFAKLSFRSREDYNIVTWLGEGVTLLSVHESHIVRLLSISNIMIDTAK